MRTGGIIDRYVLSYAVCWPNTAFDCAVVRLSAWQKALYI